MYSDSELDAAAQAGVLSPEHVHALRLYVARQRAASIPDEEHFRFLTGFNDIFVAIAIVILLVATAWIGNVVGPLSTGPMKSPLGGILTAAAAWSLAEYFTRVRRMALPSIVLLLGFAYGVGSAALATGASLLPDSDDRTMSLLMSAAAILTALAIFAHWRRFAVPITIAALTAAVVATICGLLVASFPALENAPYGPVLVCGLAVFALAMRWDMSDRERVTRRADVAFWLHLLAAPLIAHSLFNLLGVFREDMSTGTATIVIGLYLLFGVVALVIDRRALLVSSLAYVLYALYQLFQRAGAIELSAALTALVIGSALLTLSAFWPIARGTLLSCLPSGLADRLPLPGPQLKPAATPA
ncbi:hypothetical protein [Sphingobium sp. CR28]|uniref:hypothetical protein n=1 Tax=Sphingobium sp. CR28 TaxID=3400272 RepID=UPI003FF124D5